MNVGQTRIRQFAQVAHAIGLGVGKGFECAAIGDRHGWIVDAEVANVQLVDHNIFGCGQCRFRQCVPASGFQVGVIQVDDLRAGAVGGQTERVRIGDEVAFNLAGRAHKHFDFIQIVFVLPICRARVTPYASRQIKRRRINRAGCGWQGIIKNVQLHRFGGRCPQTEGRHNAVKTHAQIAVVGVQVVQHTRDLQRGCVNQVHRRLKCFDGELAFKDSFDQGQIRWRDFESLVAGKMRELGFSGDAQTSGSERQRDGTAASNATRSQGEAAVGRVAQTHLILSRNVGVPSDGIGGNPMGFGQANIALWCAVRNRQHFTDRVPLEINFRAIGRHSERNICAIRSAANTVVFRPTFVDRNFGVVVARRNHCRSEYIGAVAVQVFQPRAQTIGVPIVGTTEFALEAARNGGDDRVFVAGDPMRGVVIIELHWPSGCLRERNIPAALPITFVPRTIHGRFIVP